MTTTIKKTASGLPSLNREEMVAFIEKWQAMPNPKKGILLMGEVGVGKTTLLKDQFMGKHANGQTYNCFVSAHDLVKAYNDKGINEFMQQFRTVYTPSVDCVDDLGTEIVGNHYGSKLDVIEYLVQDWYSKGRKPSFTTNLSTKGLIERYGKRVYDRLQEMCYFVVLDDTNLRQTDHYSDVTNLINN